MINAQRSNKNMFCGEWFREDRLDKVVWAAALVWAGLVILANNLGYLNGQGWSLFFVGAGMLALFELSIRLLLPAHRRDLFGTLLWAGLMFLLSGWSLFWPIALIATGAYILLRSSFRSSKVF